jgi:hypothetical protein
VVTHSADISFEYAVREIGCQALPLLNGPRTGHVSALFDSSFYIKIEHALMCLGHTEMHTSSLNLVTDVPASVNWPASGIRTGDRVRILDDRIWVGNCLVFRTGEAARWSPDPFPTGWTAENLRAGLDVASKVCERLAPEEGLARFIQSPRPTFNHHSVCAHAASPIDALSRWLSNSDPDPDWPAQLLGLGPGLTPSGDDFIAGMMIALHGIGEIAKAELIWQAALPQAHTSTNPISYAHLQSASAGYGSAALHNAISMIVCGRTVEIQYAITRAASIGHTSGWDALAGAVAACRHLLSIREK